MELAALAGKPGAARAAGRAMRLCPPGSDVPWHRVVAADGSLAKREGCARTQLDRLRAEGARAGEGEALGEWAQRVGAVCLGKLPERVFVRPGDRRLRRWSALRVEPFASEAAARARGFRAAGGDDAPPELGRVRAAVTSTEAPKRPLDVRLARIDGAADLATQGWFVVRGLLAPTECDAVHAASRAPGAMDRTTHMLPKGYGVGAYHYWSEPLPPLLAQLRERLYGALLEAADTLRGEATYPPTLDAFWATCRAADQRRPSSILIQYPEGGVNHPHRDVYGPVWFPYQALLLLSRRGRDFEGGEFVLLEERADGERRHEIPVSEGDLVVFGTRMRWDASGPQPRKVPLRHAMAPVTRGEREAVGLVFHLAE